MELQLAAQGGEVEISSGAMGRYSVGGMKHGCNPLRLVPPV